MEMTRKSTEQLMLEVHSKLTNEQVNEKKAELLIKYAENGLSNNALIEIIAKDIGINMDSREETKTMEGEKELKGFIEKKSMDTGISAKNGKPWTRWAYNIGDKTLATFTDMPFTVGQNVVVKYVDNVSGSNTYHNIQTMELEAGSVVKEETIGVKPTETVCNQVKPVINNSLTMEYFEDLNGNDLSKRLNDFSKTHNVGFTQTHVFSGYNARAEPENRFCAFVWWK